MLESLWQSWSQKGCSVASTILKIPIEGVLPTINHLDLFNLVLKQKHIPRWQRSGSCLHFDFLIQILINNILPDIFATHISIKAYQAWLTERFEKLAGGVDLVDSKTRSSKQGVVCWWESENQKLCCWFIMDSCSLYNKPLTRIDMRPTAFLAITLQTPSNITFTCIIAGLVHACAWTS